MDTSKILQRCLHHQILTTDTSDLEGGSSAGQDVSPGSIHIWSARYSSLERYYPLLSSLVSPEEIQKAAGFKKPGDTRRYILRHGMERIILGEYIHEDPEKIRFVKAKNGKPDLDTGGNFPDIQFSLSRTDEMVCLGITRKSKIGLDMVKINPRYPFSEIEQYLFAPGERRWVARTIPELRPMKFFRIWSLKEALLKATGGDVRMMKETDVSGIITERFLNGFYLLRLGKKDIMFFIHESDCGEGHHSVLASYKNE
jgi:4'-phosphopantetheinyl transferase